MSYKKFEIWQDARELVIDIYPVRYINCYQDDPFRQKLSNGVNKMSLTDLPKFEM